MMGANAGAKTGLLCTLPLSDGNACDYWRLHGPGLHPPLRNASPSRFTTWLPERAAVAGQSHHKDQMRSSKKRPRSSQNRPRPIGNIINRVFDSSGPEGKVRGTPQQIIEKYQMLARDAQLSNDRVAAENFLQHAEHYTRMLAEASREMAAEQEARQQQYQQSGGQSGGQGGNSNGNQSGGQNGGQNGGQIGNPNGNQNGNPSGGQNPSQGGGQQGNQQPRGDRQGDGRDRGERFDRGDRQDRQDRPDRQPENRERGERRQDPVRDYREERSFIAEAQPMASDVIDLDAGDDTGLVETPESVARGRTAVKDSAQQSDAPTMAVEDRSAPRRARGPRKPKETAKPDGEPPQEAAE